MNFHASYDVPNTNSQDFVRFWSIGSSQGACDAKYVVRLEDIHHCGDCFDVGLCLLNLETTSESVETSKIG